MELGLIVVCLIAIVTMDISHTRHINDLRNRVYDLEHPYYNTDAYESDLEATDSNPVVKPVIKEEKSEADKAQQNVKNWFVYAMLLVAFIVYLAFAAASVNQ